MLSFGQEEQRIQEVVTSLNKIWLDNEIQVLKGRPIWLETIEDCELVQRVCLLPDSWGLLDQLANRSLNVNDLAYLKEERFAALSTINNTF